MKTTSMVSKLFSVLAFAVLTVTPALAIPETIQWQGRLLVNNVPQSGQTKLKLALVQGNGTVFWTNSPADAGGVPQQPITVSVTEGFYSVLLGDTSISQMAALPAPPWAAGSLSLRVWVETSPGNYSVLPDQGLAAVPWAMIAREAVTVPDGSITSSKLAPGAVTSAALAPGAVTSAALANGAVQTGHLANGAVTTAKLAPQSVTASAIAAGTVATSLEQAGYSTVPAGGIVMSFADQHADLIDSGYLKLSSIPMQNVWQTLPTTANAPTGRTGAKSVWATTKWLVWGGNVGTTPLATGSQFDPRTHRWTAMTQTGAPEARSGHSAEWTGTELIVWGGIGAGGTFLTTGARYMAATDTWTALPTLNAPAARRDHSSVWTGTQLIIWGGTSSSGIAYQNGHAWTAATNQWSTLPLAGTPPSARSLHTAVWTGSEMIVWGGLSGGVSVNTGSRYVPSTGSWLPMSTTAAPLARQQHMAVWTGQEMIVWGGINHAGVYRSSGATYSPSTDTWPVAMSTADSPVGRTGAVVAWDGARGGFVVWGGMGNSGLLSTGGTWTLASNTWLNLTTTNAPAARQGAAGAWHGADLFLFGGSGQGGTALNSGSIFSAATQAWMFQK